MGLANPLSQFIGCPIKRGGSLNDPPLALYDWSIMGKFEDYINGLEGKDDLKIEDVVSEMLNIHNDEMGIATAKITDLDAKIVEGNTAIANMDAEIQRVKAKNWDLANQVPAEELNNQPTNKGDEKPDASQITIDDLFEGK